jgi:hypothetical protein
MPARPLQALRAAVSSTDSGVPDADPPEPATGPDPTPGASRRQLLAGLGTAASAGLAGCAGRLPGQRTSLDVATRVQDDRVVWDYPADAVADDEGSDGIGYAAARFDAVDTAGREAAVEPALVVRLNSTVGGIAASEPYRDYQADAFRFRLGVPSSYDGDAALRATIEPPVWPTVRTTYGYENDRRTLVVAAPEVDSDGTVVVEGRFRSSRPVLPRQLVCGVEVKVSRPGPLGRAAVASDRESFDLSSLDLPEGVTLG